MKSHFGMGSKNLKKCPTRTQKKMKEIYYDTKHEFSGVEALIRKTVYFRMTVEKWLGRQKVYTLHKLIKHRFKGVRSKFWNFLYYWSDLTEIFTQYVKSKKKTLFVHENFSI